MSRTFNILSRTETAVTAVFASVLSVVTVGVAVAKSAATAPTVTTDRTLANAAITAVSVRERLLKVRFMMGSKVLSFRFAAGHSVAME